MRRLLVMRAAVGQSGRQEQSQNGNGQAWCSGRFRGRQPRILSLSTTLLQVRPGRLNTGQAEVTPVDA